MRQLNHSETINSSKTFSLVVLCEDIHSPQNVGMIFRICEVMGVQHLYLTGTSPAPPDRKISKAARSAEKKVLFTWAEDTSLILGQLKAENYALIGLEITDESKDIRTFDFSDFGKIGLIVGAENYGISEATLHQLDWAIKIPMFGKLTSLNVVSALSIGLYEITKQWTSRPIKTP